MEDSPGGAKASTKIRTDAPTQALSGFKDNVRRPMTSTVTGKGRRLQVNRA
jgi:hypothetical protein